MSQQSSKFIKSPLTLPDGTVSAPAFSFASETNTGWFRKGSLNPQLAVGGVLGLDLFKNGSVINFGLGTTADTGTNNPFLMTGVFSGTQYYQFWNSSTGATSASVLQVLNGSPSLAVSLSLENHAYTQAGYLAGVCVVSAGSGCAPQFNIMNEWASGGNITFNIGGRTAAKERMVLTETALTLSKGSGSLVLSGATSGALTINVPATVTSYAVVMPAAQGAANTNLNNDGAGNLSWKALTAPTIQTFLSGSGTYTKPAGVLYLRVRLVGSGGGGQGSGSATQGSGGAGNSTTFGTSFLTATGGGNGAGAGGGAGSAGGTATGGNVINFTGGSGEGPAGGGTNLPGGNGGVSAFGGNGPGGAAGNVGLAAIANSGSGGGGGGGTAGITTGGGGAAGGYIESLISSPSATYAYAVGAAGTAGAAGVAGFAGGAGGSGMIIVEEYYQ